MKTRNVHLRNIILGIFLLFFSVNNLAKCILYGIPGAIRDIIETINMDGPVFSIYLFAYCYLLVLNIYAVIVCAMSIISFLFRFRRRFYITQRILFVIYMLLWIVWMRNTYVLFELLYALAGIILASYWVKVLTNEESRSSAFIKFPYIHEFVLLRSNE